MQQFYGIAADFIVVVHMAYVLTVVLGLPAIWIGILLKQRWARNFWWRCGHLSMILIVVGERFAGIDCPLTIWEYRLRELAKQEAHPGQFIGRIVHGWLFYEAPPWAFTLVYSVFALMVLGSFIVAPPFWPWHREPNLTST